MRFQLMRPMRVLIGGVMAVIATCSAAQQYPSKPIVIVVPISAGGGSTDDVARTLALKLKDALGQPAIVDNRAGGNTTIGTKAVAQAAPDGHTLLVHTGTHTIIPFVEASLPYDPIKDFTPIATLGRTRYMMVVHPSVPVNTLEEFIAYAKARPGQLNIGSVGTSSGSRLAGEVFQMMAGIKMQNVPYKGASSLQNELLGGSIQVSFNTPGVVAQFIKTGKLKGLAIVGDTRLPMLPDVPTFAEAGLPGFKEQAWYGLLAPAKTPKSIVDRLAAEAARMQSAPEVREMFERQAIEPFILNPEQYASFIQAELAKMQKLIKDSNLKLGN